MWYKSSQYLIWKNFLLVLGFCKEAKLLIYILGLNVFFLWSSSSTYNCKFIVLIRSYRSPRICTSLSGFLFYGFFMNDSVFFLVYLPATFVPLVSDAPFFGPWFWVVDFFTIIFKYSKAFLAAALLAADWSPPTPWQTATGIVEIWT